MRETKYSYKILIGNPEGKRPLARYRLKCEDIINMVLKEVGWKSTNWIYLAQNRD
jgi:hypothetical protein